jgi:hypothetical protein
MKIVHVKFYQGVKVGSDTHPSMTNGQQVRHDSANKKELMQLEQVEHGILMKIGNQATLATWNNCQYVQYEIEPVVEVKKDLASALKKANNKQVES